MCSSDHPISILAENQKEIDGFTAVNTYLCMYVCIFMYVCTVCGHIWNACTCAHVLCTCMYVCMYTCAPVCMYVICAHMCTCKLNVNYTCNVQGYECMYM